MGQHPRQLEALPSWDRSKRGAWRAGSQGSMGCGGRLLQYHLDDVRVFDERFHGESKPVSAHELVPSWSWCLQPDSRNPALIH